MNIFASFGGGPDYEPPLKSSGFRLLGLFLLAFIAFLVFWFASAPTISITHEHRFKTERPR